MNNYMDDRYEKALAIRNPGYTETVQVVYDNTVKRQVRLFQFDRILMSVLTFLEILLIFRFFLRMISANPNSGFTMILYGITGFFVKPFNGLIATPTLAGFTFELTTLIAMFVYMLIFWGITYYIGMFIDLLSIRPYTNTTHS